MKGINNIEKYNDYYDRLTTFKVNSEMRAKMKKVLKKKGKTFQDFIDDKMRDYLKSENVPLSPKIRKVLEIEN